MKDLGETGDVYRDRSNSAEATEKDVEEDAYKKAKLMIACSGGVRPPGAGKNLTGSSAMALESGLVATWKEKATTVMQELASEEAAAKLLAMELGKLVGGKVVQRKHINLAEGWHKKLSTKRDHILKMKSMLGPQSDAILKNENNKYDNSLDTAHEMLGGWQSEANKELLEKVLAL